MQIAYAKPTSKGVTQLMYVGDDAIPTGPNYGAFAIIALGTLALFWWAKKTSR